MLKHKHLILSLLVKYPPHDAEETEAWLAFVIKRINMKIARADTIPKNPIAFYCENPANLGVTGVGILETSHTALHVWDSESPAKMEYDLYSCSEFDVSDIITLCKPFGIISGNYFVLDRDNGLKMLEQGVLGEDGVIATPARLAQE